MSALVEPYRSGGVSRRTLGECTCVIAAEGRFTSRSALLFARELSAARNDGCSDFVFDFADVTGVDSIAAMIFTEQRLELEDCTVVVAARHPETIVALADAPLLADWPLRQTGEEALATLLAEPVA
ncbi:MAG TPA: STAS domain-containing protein [Solirubrobacteraceae bacterium]|jgi:anti-anti-sigma regulatory factor|nr:STAS domain-containing protein [Solirubrobacteraceae bacterium]